jgi:hypothetical protein
MTVQQPFSANSKNGLKDCYTAVLNQWVCTRWLMWRSQNASVTGLLPMQSGGFAIWAILWTRSRGHGDHRNPALHVEPFSGLDKPPSITPIPWPNLGERTAGITAPKNETSRLRREGITIVHEAAVEQDNRLLRFLMPQLSYICVSTHARNDIVMAWRQTARLTCETERYVCNQPMLAPGNGGAEEHTRDKKNPSTYFHTDLFLRTRVFENFDLLSEAMARSPPASER